MKTPRCSKCGRPLKDPVSIALGIGPVCRGASNGVRHIQIRSRSSSGRVYAAGSVSAQQMNLFAPRVEEELKCSRRERILAARRVRRVAYENRQSFQIGLNSRTKEPVIYSPTPEGAWKTNDGYQATHEALGKYLRQYGMI
jgi:hypothetical protein